MFASRFTAFVDACALASALRRNLLLTLAEAADVFIADTIALDHGRAAAAVRTMRERFRRPEKTAEALLLDMEAAGLIETADVLRPHRLSL